MLDSPFVHDCIQCQPTIWERIVEKVKLKVDEIQDMDPIVKENLEVFLGGKRKRLQSRHSLLRTFSDDKE